MLLPLVSSNPALSLVALIATAAGTFAAMGPFWSMPALYLSAKAAPGGIALISTLAGVGSLISPVIVGWLNEHTKTLAAGQYYLAALMIVGAVTVVAIGRMTAKQRPETGPHPSASRGRANPAGTRSDVHGIGRG